LKDERRGGSSGRERLGGARRRDGRRRKEEVFRRRKLRIWIRLREERKCFAQCRCTLRGILRCRGRRSVDNRRRSAIGREVKAKELARPREDRSEDWFR